MSENRKGTATFGSVDHTATPQEAAQRAFHADMGPIVAAIEALAARIKPEIRVDLPAMNPIVQVAPPLCPIHVTVPDIAAPPIHLTVPEIKVPPAVVTVSLAERPRVEVSYLKLAGLMLIPPVVYVALQWGLYQLIGFVTP